MKKIYATAVYDSISERVYGRGSPPEVDANNILVTIANVVIYVGFALGIVAIAFSMIMYITSAGNPDKVSQAWKAFIWGVIASAVALGVQSLSSIAMSILGVTL